MTVGPASTSDLLHRLQPLPSGGNIVSEFIDSAFTSGFGFSQTRGAFIALTGATNAFQRTGFIGTGGLLRPLPPAQHIGQFALTLLPKAYPLPFHLPEPHLRLGELAADIAQRGFDHRVVVLHFPPPPGQPGP